MQHCRLQIRRHQVWLGFFFKEAAGLFWRPQKCQESSSAKALCVSEALQNAKCPGAPAFLTFKAPQNELFKAERIFQLEAHSVEKGAPIIYFETAIPLSK